jgi:hypothetical protein
MNTVLLGVYLLSVATVLYKLWTKRAEIAKGLAVAPR